MQQEGMGVRQNVFWACNLLKTMLKLTQASCGLKLLFRTEICLTVTTLYLKCGCHNFWSFHLSQKRDWQCFNLALMWMAVSVYLKMEKHLCEARSPQNSENRWNNCQSKTDKTIEFIYLWLPYTESAIHVTIIEVTHKYGKHPCIQ